MFQTQVNYSFTLPISPSPVGYLHLHLLRYLVHFSTPSAALVPL